MFCLCFGYFNQNKARYLAFFAVFSDFTRQSWLKLSMKSKLGLITTISTPFLHWKCVELAKIWSFRCETLKLFFSKQAQDSYYHGILAATEIANNISFAYLAMAEHIFPSSKKCGSFGDITLLTIKCHQTTKVQK